MKRAIILIKWLYWKCIHRLQPAFSGNKIPLPLVHLPKSPEVIVNRDRYTTSVSDFERDKFTLFRPQCASFKIKIWLDPVLGKEAIFMADKHMLQWYSWLEVY
jgi:hypothetical protein